MSNLDSMDMGRYKWYQSGTSPSKMWFEDEPKQKLVSM